MNEFQLGQRWISNSEAGLGLGIVVNISGRQVSISFPAAEEERTYATKNAPLTRIIYQVGDKVTDFHGTCYTVADTFDNQGTLIYKAVDDAGKEHILPELELDCFVHFNTPKDRLLSGQIDPIKFFELRYEALKYLREYQQSGVTGLLGPRVQLLPHQLYIAHQVANRVAPRVLLADEVGLGKTIEAGLIVHQQLQSGLASRVLILMPDSLLHQWLVEMLRRFNLSFSVLDEEICAELGHDQQNPFESNQLILCPLSFLVNNANRFEQAQACSWDLLVVDEAHHLEWHPGQASKEYSCVEALAQIARGVLLLTATPEQLGLDSHFARLRLLDPDRYFDFDQFVEEEEQYKPVNRIVQLLANDNTKTLPEEIENYLSEKELASIQKIIDNGDLEAAKRRALNALLDRHGTGRVLFRNTRAAIHGFPQRILETHALSFNEDLSITAPIIDWLQIERILGDDWLSIDTRITWLSQFLKAHKHEKILLICAKADTAIALEDHLRQKENIRCAVFHEGMSLIARDRAAAYFADSEDSAQLLVCSEIGSEGRNFQFAHHLVMFDLPLNPDLLEQRIGRLDRIGQTQNVHIHVPFYEDTAQATLLDWYHQGLNAFEQTCTIGQPIFQTFANDLFGCLEEGNKTNIQQLIEKTATKAAELRQLMQEGRDQLLEMNSCRPELAAEIIEKVTAAENRYDLEDFIEQCCDQLGVNIEMHSQDTVILQPSEHMHSGNLPGLDDDGITATYSRDIALSREDMAYLSWEHPIVTGAMDMILSGDHGNTAIATLKLKGLKPGTLLMEALYTVECIAPASLRLQRYLPATVIRTVVTLDGKDLSHILSYEKLSPLLERIPSQTAQTLAKQAKPQVELLINAAEIIAKEKMPEIIKAAENMMLTEQRAELTRLIALSEINANIREEEMLTLKNNAEEMAHCLAGASLRLNAIRLIMAI